MNTPVSSNPASRNDGPLIVAETELHIDVSFGHPQWVDGAGRYILEADYRVAGLLWHVHKTDPDPYPSRPQGAARAGVHRFS